MLTVVTVAIAAFAAWMMFAFASAVSVLIIACPLRALPPPPDAGHAEVLIKDAEALERMAGVDTLIVDKTGTLTLGKPTLTDTLALGEMTESHILAFAAALERESEHSLAEAIEDEATAKSVRKQDAPKFAAVTGKGVKGPVEGRKAALGNAAMF